MSYEFLFQFFSRWIKKYIYIHHALVIYYYKLVIYYYKNRTLFNPL